MTATLTHDHSDVYPLRVLPGRRGVFVPRHGWWRRPLQVWQRRGTWCITCFPCAAVLRSGLDLHDGGWPTRAAAFDAAYEHCRGCDVGAFDLPFHLDNPAVDRA